MEAYKELVGKTNGKASNKAGEHKDKLAMTKQRERELQEGHKAELQRQKEESEAARQATLALLKEERMEHDTKRSAKDRREAAKREEHAETGEKCEHGVWRCKICFPHKEGKVSHHKDRALALA